MNSRDWNDLIFDLDELRAHFEDRADINDNGGPNWEMRAQGTIENAIAQLAHLRRALTTARNTTDRQNLFAEWGFLLGVASGREE